MTSKTHKYTNKFPYYAIAILFLGTLLLYSPSLTHDFVNFDDDAYVTENTAIVQGLTPQAIKWSLTAIHSSNWHPLTWMSHALDITWFGLNPAGHHGTNILLHSLNAILLFIFLWHTTKLPWPSFIVAALFAWHPLHVESVAWIAERKDLLSTLFAWATLIAYSTYTHKPNILRYTATLTLFTLGLMSKPMLVTLPCLLLLLDLWPLNRYTHCITIKNHLRRAGMLTLEKLPFFLLVIASIAITLNAQQNAMSTLDQISPLLRIQNTLIAYNLYLWKMLYPINLAPLYPFDPTTLTTTKAMLAAIPLSLITLGSLLYIKQKPYWAIGWFWFIGTLIPVIGLIQVGNQSHADRYTYLTLTGPFIILTWAITDLGKRYKPIQSFTRILTPLLLLACCFITWQQLQIWKNSETLFRHTLNVTQQNSIAHNNLGMYLMQNSAPKEAREHFDAALKIKPNNYQAKNNLAVAATLNGDYEIARTILIQLLQAEPNNPELLTNAGFLFYELGDLNQATAYAKTALQYDPTFKKAIQLQSRCQSTTTPQPQK